MSLIPYQGCLHTQKSGTGWMTEATGPIAGEPILVGALEPPQGTGIGSAPSSTPAGATVAQATPIILASATASSPSALFATHGILRVQAPPFSVTWVSGHSVDLIFEVRLTGTIGATAVNLNPLRRQRRVVVSSKVDEIDLGVGWSDWAPIAAGQSITGTAQLVVWGTFTGGPNLGVFGARSISLTWEAR